MPDVTKIKWYKTVMMPIRVSNCDYCWEQVEPYRICPHFSNEGGHPICDLNIAPLAKNSFRNLIKPDACLKLTESEAGK